ASRRTGSAHSRSPEGEKRPGACSLPRLRRFRKFRKLAAGLIVLFRVPADRALERDPPDVAAGGTGAGFLVRPGLAVHGAAFQAPHEVGLGLLAWLRFALHLTRDAETAATLRLFRRRRLPRFLDILRDLCDQFLLAVESPFVPQPPPQLDYEPPAIE